MANKSQSSRYRQSRHYVPGDLPALLDELPPHLADIIAAIWDEFYKLQVSITMAHDHDALVSAPPKPRDFQVRFADGSPGWDPGLGRGPYYWDEQTEQWVLMAGIGTGVSPPSTGNLEHDMLDGLGDDDHTQYHNDTRGDARYYTQAQIDARVLGDLADVSVPTPTDGYQLTWVSANNRWEAQPAGGSGGGSTTWVGLTDTPGAFTGAADQVPAVNSGETALEFQWRAPAENGFENRTDSTLAFVDGTRTFTITPAVTSFSYFHNGQKYTKSSAENVVIANTEGLHFIYYNGTTLSETTTFTPDLITTYALVAVIYWSVTDSAGILFGDERHGNQMDAITHMYNHLTLGARYQSGLGLGNMTVDGTGNSDADAQFSVADGEIWDEDIQHTITDDSPQDLSTIAQIPLYYRSGASGDWRKIAATNFPVTTTGTGRAAYNQDTGATWQLTEVDNNDFVLTHLFATGDVNSPIIGIVGQAGYGNVVQAREGALTELNNLAFGALGDLTPEYVPIATVIYQTSNGYTNTVQSRVRSTDTGDDYIDWRTTKGAGGSSGLVDHTHSEYLTVDEYWELSVGF